MLGKHNLTLPVSAYYRPEVVPKSQTYFFTHSIKTLAVTSTAKGITSKQILIGTIGDQVSPYCELTMLNFWLFLLHSSVGLTDFNLKKIIFLEPFIHMSYNSYDL